MTILLAAARVLPLVWLAPPFGGRHAPAFARVAVALALAVLIAPSLSVAAPAVTGFVPLATIALHEAAAGILLGFLVSLPFHAAEAAGALADQSIGLERRFADLFGLLAIVVFFAVGGHLVLVRALAESYEALPLGGAIKLAPDRIVLATAGTILAAIGMAAPILAALVVVDVALALVQRTAPRVPVALGALRPLAVTFAAMAALAAIALAMKGELLGAISEAARHL
jgi:flagellar biosynthetic protein FliR